MSTSSSRGSRLPAAGGNLFQEIKKKCVEAKALNPELNLIKLSIGQPSGPALEPARQMASGAIWSTDQEMHEYQDNGCLVIPDFAKRFVAVHVDRPIHLLREDQISFLPIPGIKPMLGVIIQAMGAWSHGNIVQVGTMTSPGYPTPTDQCRMQKEVRHVRVVMDPEQGFLPTVQNLKVQDFGENDLLMFNFPHNPTGIIATADYWAQICSFCEREGIAVFSDEAYHILRYSNRASSLVDVAPDFPNLRWAAAFSASKAGNFTGWRIGAIAGSPDFVGDIARIKGNTDSGFVAPLAAGVLHLFEKHRESHIVPVLDLYRRRVQVLMGIFDEVGLRIAVRPEGGFFILCNAPLRAFGQDLASANEFNDLMIANTGVVGVPFDGKWIRYAVCTEDVEVLAPKLREAFGKAQVSY